MTPAAAAKKSAAGDGGAIHDFADEALSGPAPLTLDPSSSEVVRLPRAAWLALRGAIRAREPRPRIFAVARVGMRALPDVPEDLRARRAGEHPRDGHRGQPRPPGAEQPLPSLRHPPPAFRRTAGWCAPGAGH